MTTTRNAFSQQLLNYQASQQAGDANHYQDLQYTTNQQQLQSHASGEKSNQGGFSVFLDAARAASNS